MDKAAFYRGEQSSLNTRSRLSSIGLVIAGHAGLLAMLLWVSPILPPVPAPRTPIVIVHILPDLVRFKSADVSPKYNPVVPARVPLVMPPDIVIESPKPSPITVAAPPSLGHGVTQAALDEYLTRLHDHIARFMDYPILARLNGDQGTAQVHFIMDAGNHVILVELHKSSGSTLLDKEALAMVKRAEPLPPVPPGMGPGLNALLPIEFTLLGQGAPRYSGFAH